jgi:hypothetical protein
VEEFYQRKDGEKEKKYSFGSGEEVARHHAMVDALLPVCSARMDGS